MTLPVLLCGGSNPAAGSGAGRVVPSSQVYERPGSYTLAFEFAMRLHKGSELTLLVQLVELGVGGLLSRSYVPPFYVPPWP